MASGGVGCSTSTSGMPIRAASARALSAHTPFSSPRRVLGVLRQEQADPNLAVLHEIGHPRV